MRPIKEVNTVLNAQGYSLETSIIEVMKEFNFKTLIHRAGIAKACGYSIAAILTLVLMLPLMLLENTHQFYKSHYAKEEHMKKDTIYRMKNNPNYPWRRLLYAVAKAFRKLAGKTTSGSSSGVTALILDDTTDSRVGYKMENISHVFDHVIRKTVYGYKILVLSFFDGTTNHPLDFSIHTEKPLAAKKRRKQFKKDVDPRSPGGKRRKEAHTTKIRQAIAMIKRAVKNGFVPDYVLCDSWFTCEELIKAIRDAARGKIHLIAGVPNGNRKYGYKDGLFNAKEITAMLKKSGKVHRCRKWNTRYMEAVVEYKGAGPLKMFISRYPGQKKWRVFVTTNAGLSYVQMMEVYGIRWTIEVLFRECKQRLLLGKCQSNDFDAQIASTTITFILYTFLSHLKRQRDYTTLGDVLLLIQEDVCEKNLAQRLFDLFEALLELAINTISQDGSIDISQFKNSPEWQYIRQVLSSSFLFEQMDSVDNAA